MANRRDILRRNLSYGAVIGAGIGGMQAMTSKPGAGMDVVAGYALGGAIGGGVLFVLVAAIASWIIRQMRA